MNSATYRMYVHTDEFRKLLANPEFSKLTGTLPCIFTDTEWEAYLEELEEELEEEAGDYKSAIHMAYPSLTHGSIVHRLCDKAVHYPYGGELGLWGSAPLTSRWDEVTCSDCLRLRVATESGGGYGNV